MLLHKQNNNMSILACVYLAEDDLQHLKSALSNGHASENWVWWTPARSSFGNAQSKFADSTTLWAILENPVGGSEVLHPAFNEINDSQAVHASMFCVLIP